MVKLGIIGYGNMGSAHALSIIEGDCHEIELAAVADRNEVRRNMAGKALPDTVAIFAEGTDLIDSAICDAVLIATPHYQHPDLAIYAFAHGQHVMCEKPAGVYTLQVRDMIAAADKYPSLTFAMMFNQRTNCVYRKMHDMIKNSEIGEIKRISWLITDWYRTQHYYDAGAWRATWDGEGGGVLINQCPHQMDLLQWLCGMPATVTAFCHEGKWHDIEVEDDVTAYFTYSNGATGVFVTTTGDACGTNRLEITGTLGKLVCENDIVTLDKLAVDERVWGKDSASGFSTKPESRHYVVDLDGKNPQHPAVLNAFAANILRGEPLIADGREGIRGLMLSNAIHLSGWLGKTVALPVDEQLFLDELNKRRATSKIKTGESVYADIRSTYGSTKK